MRVSRARRASEVDSKQGRRVSFGGSRVSLRGGRALELGAGRRPHTRKCLPLRQFWPVEFYIRISRVTGNQWQGELGILGGWGVWWVGVWGVWFKHNISFYVIVYYVVWICIYIYIYRERERTYMYNIYIYICIIHTYVYIYIYIYIYVYVYICRVDWASPRPGPSRPRPRTRRRWRACPGLIISIIIVHNNC